MYSHRVIRGELEIMLSLWPWPKVVGHSCSWPGSWHLWFGVALGWNWAVSLQQKQESLRNVMKVRQPVYTKCSTKTFPGFLSSAQSIFTNSQSDVVSNLSQAACLNWACFFVCSLLLFIIIIDLEPSFVSFWPWGETGVPGEVPGELWSQWIKPMFRLTWTHTGTSLVLKELDGSQRRRREVTSQRSNTQDSSGRWEFPAWIQQIVWRLSNLWLKPGPEGGSFWR